MDLTFEQIEDAFPEMDGCYDMGDGYVRVSARWLHAFAHNLALHPSRDFRRAENLSDLVTRLINVVRDVAPNDPRIEIAMADLIRFNTES